MGRVSSALKARFLRFRREIIVVGYAVRHPETPLGLKLAGVGLILYLVSPIDLIPIMVPVVGLLDDLILVPWGLSQVVGRLPPAARADAEADATRFIARFVKRPIVFLALLLCTLLLLWSVLLWVIWAVMFA